MKSRIVVFLALFCVAVLKIYYPAGAQQQARTPDEQAEMALYAKMGKPGDVPPALGKKFIPAPDFVRPVADSWNVVFTTEAIGKAEQTALDLAEIYGLKVRRRSVVDLPDTIAGAMFTGSEKAARKLAEDPLVRHVEQDQQWITEPGTRGTILDAKQLTAEQRKPLVLDRGKASLKLSGQSEPEGLWDYAADEAFGAPPLAETGERNPAPDRAALKAQEPAGATDPESGKPSPDRSANRLMLEPEQVTYRASVDYSLDRHDTRGRSYDGRYYYRSLAQNVDMYVVDSGVSIHDEFGTGSCNSCQRVLKYRDAYPGITVNDCTGHGTAVASVGAGTTQGIASLAEIISIRVYDCSNNLAPISTVNQYFIDMAARTAASPAFNAKKQAVVNLSFYGPANTGFDTGIFALLYQNIPIFGATGQSFTFYNHARDLFPGNYSGVTLVGMTDNLDRKFTAGLFGTYCLPAGPCFQTPFQFNDSDIFAVAGPAFELGSYSTVWKTGVKIAVPGNAYTPNTAGSVGTSLASPRVAGMAAVWLGSLGVNYRPSWRSARDSVLKSASTGRISNLTSSDFDRLLYSLPVIGSTKNAASYNEGIAPNSLGVTFAGFQNLLGQTLTPQSMVIRDPDNGLAYGGSFSFTSASQVNFISGNNIPAGPKSVEYYNTTDGFLGMSAVTFANVAPGVLALNGSGQGTANGQLLLVEKANPINQTYVAFNSNGNSWNSSTHDAYIILYGTGWRGHNGTNAMQMKNGDTIYDSASNFSILYMGAVSGQNGLDQVNFGPIPPVMLGQNHTWELKLYVNGSPGSSNAVLANITTVKIN